MNRVNKFLAVLFLLFAPVQGFAACIDSFLAEDFIIACDPDSSSGFISKGVCAIEDNVVEGFGKIYCQVTDNAAYKSLVTAALLLYIIFAGIAAVINLNVIRIKDLVVHIATIVIIYGLTIKPEIMLQTIYPVIIGAPLEIAKWITGADNISAIIGSMEGALFNFFNFDLDQNLGMKDFLTALFNYSLMPFGIFLLMLSVLLLLVFFLIRSFFISIISLMFLVMISPLIAIGQLFGATRHFIKNWLEYVISFMLQPVIVITLIAILFGTSGTDGMISREIDKTSALIFDTVVEDRTYTLDCSEAENKIEAMSEQDKLEVDKQNCGGVTTGNYGASKEGLPSLEISSTAKTIDNPNSVAIVVVQVFKLLAICLATLTFLGLLGSMANELSSTDPRQVSTVPRGPKEGSAFLYPDSDDDGDGDDYGQAKDAKLFSTKEIRKKFEKRAKKFKKAFNIKSTKSTKNTRNIKSIRKSYARNTNIFGMPKYYKRSRIGIPMPHLAKIGKSKREMLDNYIKDYVHGDKLLGQKLAIDNLREVGIDVNKLNFNPKAKSTPKAKSKLRRRVENVDRKLANTTNKIRSSIKEKNKKRANAAFYANRYVEYGSTHIDDSPIKSSDDQGKPKKPPGYEDELRRRKKRKPKYFADSDD